MRALPAPEVVLHPLVGPGQGEAPGRQHHQHAVGEQGGEVDHLGAGGGTQVTLSLFQP